MYKQTMAAASYPPTNLWCTFPSFLPPFSSPVRSPGRPPTAFLCLLRENTWLCTCSRQCSRRRQHLLRRGCWWNQTERGWVGVMPSKRDLGLRVRCVFTDQDSVLRSRLSSQQHHTRLIGVPKNRHHSCTTYYMHTFTPTHTPHHTQHTQHMLHLVLTRGTSVLCELSLATGLHS